MNLLMGMSSENESRGSWFTFSSRSKLSGVSSSPALVSRLDDARVGPDISKSESPVGPASNSLEKSLEKGELTATKRRKNNDMKISF